VVLPYTVPSGHRWPLLVVRALACLLLIQVIVQAALAGGFISGNVTMLGLHSANGILLVLTSAALIPAAVLLWRPGRGPWWPVLFAGAYWFLIAVQVGIGFTRTVGLHIPLGVAAFGLICGFTWWACAYRRTPAAVAA
jgi:hypothetical protein